MELKGPLVTKDMIKESIKQMGVTEGMALFVHSSLKQIGWIPGGAQTLITALMETVGEDGLIMMAAQSTDNSDPKNWMNPPVPEEWWQTIRDELPAFDPARTVTRGIGVVPELFRTYPGVYRSAHPMWSVSAWGKGAADIVSDHTLEAGFGPGSPIDKFLGRDGHVLHLGSPWDSTTVWHFAEYGIEGEVIEYGCAMIEDGERVFKTFSHLDIDSEMFGPIGTSLIGKEYVKSGRLGNAEVHLVSARESMPEVMLQLNSMRNWLMG